MFGDVSSIAFSTSRDMRTTAEYRMALFPAVLALWNIWVHIGTLNGSNKLTYIEATVNDVLSQRTILGILDVHPNHCHIGFRGCFNDMRF